jgi:hypothetical protein
MSLLRSSLDDPGAIGGVASHIGVLSDGHTQALCSADPNESDLLALAPSSAFYFKADTPPELISIIQNDWPYSGQLFYPSFRPIIPTLMFAVVPTDVEHSLIWTRRPIINFNDVPPKITTRLHHDGLWGFTGSLSPPPSPSTLPSCLPALTEWGITMDKLVCSPKGTVEEEEMVRMVGSEVDRFVRNRWVEREWETAWFVNPPVGI